MCIAISQPPGSGLVSCAMARFMRDSLVKQIGKCKSEKNQIGKKNGLSNAVLRNAKLILCEKFRVFNDFNSARSKIRTWDADSILGQTKTIVGQFIHPLRSEERSA